MNQGGGNEITEDKNETEEKKEHEEEKKEIKEEFVIEKTEGYRDED